VLTAALVSLAAQEPAARFLVLDGTAVDSRLVGYLERVCDALPQRVLFGSSREDVPGVLAEAAAEVERRAKAAPGPPAPCYLLIHNLPRFRDLRRAEDDFGFGRRGDDQAATPAQQLVTVLREGPALGVHVVAWCDSLNNLNRCFDRPALREFEM